MRLPRAVWGIVSEIGRHVLRRPVVGVVVAARSEAQKWVLVRRHDTGDWALPGGTLEWGETLRKAVERELAEEAGVDLISLGRLCGVYSRPNRDFRFHAVTVVVEAAVTSPRRPPRNPLEITEVGEFAEAELPKELSHNLTDMLSNVLKNRTVWE